MVLTLQGNETRKQEDRLKGLSMGEPLQIYAPRSCNNIARLVNDSDPLAISRSIRSARSRPIKRLSMSSVYPRDLSVDYLSHQVDHVYSTGDGLFSQRIPSKYSVTPATSSSSPIHPTY